MNENNSSREKLTNNYKPEEQNFDNLPKSTYVGNRNVNISLQRVRKGNTSSKHELHSETRQVK